MPTTLQIYQVHNCSATSAHGLWREILEKRLDTSSYEYVIPGNRLRAWDTNTTLQKTPVKDIFYKDGIEISRVSMPSSCEDTFIGFNFCRLYFKDGEKYPAYESHAELFPAGKTPPILHHLPLVPTLQPFIDVINQDSELISPVENIEYTALAPAIQFQFPEKQTTANALSSDQFARAILPYIRNKQACHPIELELALIIPFTKNPDRAKIIATETTNVLSREWGCRLDKKFITTAEELEQWINTNPSSPRYGFFALDTHIGERPPQVAIDWMRFLEDAGIAYSLFNSSSNPIYTRHGNAMHILTKLGGSHYHTFPASVPDLPNHWCIGLDLGFGAQYKGKMAVMTLTDGKGKLHAYWRALKDMDETLTQEILEEGIRYLVDQAESIAPDRKFIAIRDGRCPKHETIEFYQNLLPQGRSVLIEYAKKGNPMMLNGNQQPDAATLCTLPGSSDGFLFTAKAPQRECLTNTVKFFSRHNDLNYTTQQLAEILCALCFAPKLSFQPSSLPAPIYWADGIASLSMTNLQFAGWAGVPHVTRDFRQAKI
ncbi:hypothetical protein JIN77_02650 [Verrucomicrobiaceae bacterium R5-34]|nr:hypothetical protein [Verrucomicrobiaceae bacterium R5-34]